MAWSDCKFLTLFWRPFCVNVPMKPSLKAEPSGNSNFPVSLFALASELCYAGLGRPSINYQ